MTGKKECKTVLELEEAIRTGTWEGDPDDPGDELMCYEDHDRFATAMILEPGRNAVEFHPETREKRLCLWVTKIGEQPLEFRIDANEEETGDSNVVQGSKNIFSARLHSLRELPELIDLLRNGTAALNDPVHYERKGLHDLLDLFFVVPCGRENRECDFRLFPARSMAMYRDHEAIDMLASMFLVIDEEHLPGSVSDRQWKAAWIMKTEMFWKAFHETYHDQLYQWGLEDRPQPGDQAWHWSGQYNMIWQQYASEPGHDIRRETNRPAFVTRIRAGNSLNFINDEVEDRVTLHDFFTRLYKEGFEPAGVYDRFAGTRVALPPGFMGQVRHSFECRHLRSRLAERFTELAMLTNGMATEDAPAYYRSRLAAIDEFLYAGWRPANSYAGAGECAKGGE